MNRSNKERLRELETRPCRRCGAEAGQHCETASGTPAPWAHAERMNDSAIAAGKPPGFVEGTNLTTHPPRNRKSS